MKKLMIAAVAMAASVAMADVTSANIVGFAQSDLAGNFGATGTQFVMPSDVTKFDLSAVSVVSDGADWSFYLTVVNDDGSSGDTYTWTDADGWVDDGYQPIVGVNFVSGIGFCYQNDTGDIIALRSSGQVGTKDIEFEANGFGMIANTFPTEVALQDILVSGDGVDWAVYLTVINDDGSSGDTYTWTDADGWVDDGYAPVSNDVKIAAGYSFAFQTDTAAVITIPAPVL